MTNFRCLVAINIRHHSTTSAIGTRASDKSRAAALFVADCTRIELLTRASATIDPTENSIPNAGKDAKAQITEDVFDPTVVAILRKADHFIQTLGGSFAASNQGALGALFGTLKKSVARFVVNTDIMGITTRSTNATVRHKARRSGSILCFDLFLRAKGIYPNGSFVLSNV